MKKNTKSHSHLRILYLENRNVEFFFSFLSVQCLRQWCGKKNYERMNNYEINRIV